MENLELFGKMLMTEVRDRYVRYANSIVDGTVKAPRHIQYCKSLEGDKRKISEL